MRYEGKIYRPPSEADAFILQATIGCSWNKSTYCDMYRDKTFSVRSLEEVLADIQLASTTYGHNVQKVFVADGDALILDMTSWRAILAACKDAFPSLRRVSCYAVASNILEKSAEERGKCQRPKKKLQNSSSAKRRLPRNKSSFDRLPNAKAGLRRSKKNYNLPYTVTRKTNRHFIERTTKTRDLEGQVFNW